ncbi:hypothetical protein HRR83_008630 [Exophiala dermatitidis]|uniref:OsmC family protein n=1 Tax=Exophiala dermatitidis TaxID=5970 RepID=A0AAN6EYS0_EXODE|nr:hypothetical protein HRR75_007752 [Exophiala dermatitidis]KAJ4505631.1 hypothetical protein HRR73_008445 [Exophiala dermatitidis]KAJ4506008.1 hypothetical protein HRR74_008438 [Exophiala dermatitidis]KAJ4536618.1 hypothetical protein HRR76_004651 [Exophiala dermatitidis]KAJ4555780.1 hypothetical protein HRR77_001703 [Exophiala dermatitidis]
MSSDPATIAANALRAKQKPLKDKYRSDPSSALVTLSSSGTLDPTSTSLTCSLSAGTAARKVAGLHKAAGGEGFDATGELCSGDMLLESLVACFGVTVRAVATSMGIAIKDGSIKVEGDLDFRGTMGIKDADGNAVPVGFKKIRLFVSIEVDSDEDKEKLGKLIELSERYCVVLQTLRAGVQVETSLNSRGGDAKEKATSNDTDTQQHIPANENVLKVN